MRKLIYKLTNVRNGKVYIGQTTQTAERRFSEHASRAKMGNRDHKLYLAIKKYGIEAFEMEVLCCALDAKYLDELEISFIKEYNSFNRGYNSNAGGCSVSDATKKKLSAIFTGRKLLWANKIWASRRANGTDKAHNKGVKRESGFYYLVQMPNSNDCVVVNGLRKFCAENGLDSSTMHAVLAGKQNHHKGYILRARLNDYPKWSTLKRAEVVNAQ